MNRWLATLALLASFGSWGTFFFVSNGVLEHLFGCTDYLIVSTLSTIPLAATIHQLLKLRSSSREGIISLILLMVVACTFISDLGSLIPKTDTTSQILFGFSCSLTISMLMWISFSWLFSPGINTEYLVDRSDNQNANLFPHGVIAQLILSGFVATILPLTYRDFLIHHYEQQTRDALSQQRIVKASESVDRLTCLAPSGEQEWGSHRALSQQLNRQIEASYNQISQLPRPTSVQEYGILINALVQMEELDLAQQKVQSVLRTQADLPQAWDTLGLIHQRKENWQESLDCYQRALDLWKSDKNSNSYQAGMLSAFRGMALADRKLGNMTAASGSYQSLVQLAPTPSHHLLAAKFYEDIQETSLAKSYADRVIQTGNQSQISQAQGIIDKLQISHFGCFQVFFGR